LNNNILKVNLNNYHIFSSTYLDDFIATFNKDICVSSLYSNMTSCPYMMDNSGSLVRNINFII